MIMSLHHREDILVPSEDRGGSKTWLRSDQNKQKQKKHAERHRRHQNKANTCKSLNPAVHLLWQVYDGCGSLVGNLNSDVSLTAFFWRSDKEVDSLEIPICIEGERLGYIHTFLFYVAQLWGRFLKKPVFLTKASILLYKHLTSIWWWSLHLVCPMPALFSDLYTHLVHLYRPPSLPTCVDGHEKHKHTIGDIVTHDVRQMLPRARQRES